MNDSKPVAMIGGGGGGGGGTGFGWGRVKRNTSNFSPFSFFVAKNTKIKI